MALVVALVELLLLLSACCFADHIRKLQDGGDSEKTNSEKEGIIDSNEEAYSIHHEESKCHSVVCVSGIKTSLI